VSELLVVDGTVIPLFVVILQSFSQQLFTQLILRLMVPDVFRLKLSARLLAVTEH